PLLVIFNGKNINAIENPRFQRILSKLSYYTFNVTWVSGKTHLIADALSRAPLSNESGEEIDILQCSLSSVGASRDVSFQELTIAAQKDPEYQAIIDVFNSKSKIDTLPPQHRAKMFSNIWNEISFDDQHRILLFHNRVIVPRLIRRSLLDKLHLSHSGITKTRSLARALYYWPSMNREINNIISSCEQCTRLLPSQPFTPLQQSISQHPFQVVSVDLFEEKGQHYLIIMKDLKSKNQLRMQNLQCNLIVNVQDPLTKKWTETGTVITRCSSGQSYEVNINGSKRIRNRRLLRLVPEFSKTPEGKM
ncbi:hypothetical protein TCAL_16081, partial [Tigriopus californicus]